jgi:hypothetical protein
VRPTQTIDVVTPDDLAQALAFALRFDGRKRVHNADEIIAEIVVKRLVDYLERPLGRHEAPADRRDAAIARGFER